MTGQLDFSFSDLIAGYIRKVDFPDVFDSQGFVDLETSDGRTFTVKVTSACYAELVRNLGEPFQVAPSMRDLLKVGRFLHAYGLFYPEANGLKFEAKHILLERPLISGTSVLISVLKAKSLMVSRISTLFHAWSMALPRPT
jgi:hypothetical protein